MKRENKHQAAGEYGGSSLIVAIMTGIALSGAVAYFYDDINATRTVKARILFSEGVETINVDIAQRLSQLIQSETIKVGADGKFMWDAAANNNGWQPTGTDNATEITFRSCNFDALPNNSQMILAGTPSNQYDTRENQLCSNYRVATKVKVEAVTTTGTDEFATISINSSSNFKGAVINSGMKAKVQLGKSGGAVAIPATCPWDDPTYRKSMYLQGGRHMAGWAMLGKNVNYKHKELHGHTSSYWKSSVPSGKHYRGDTATHKVKGMGYVIGNYEYFAWVYTPKPGHGLPGECFLAIGAIRHNCWGCGCFTEETKIRMADGTDKIAKDIIAGDYVWNPVRNKPARVMKTTLGKEYEPLVQLGLGDRRITVTSLHPFMTTEGLKQAKNLRMSDRIAEPDGTFTDITHLDRSDPGENTWVYNFALDTESGHPDDHMVLADGIVTGDRFLQDQLARDELSRTAGIFNLYEAKKPYRAEYRPGF